MTISHSDAYYQYVDGKKLLSTTLLERERLLHQLEKLAKAPQKSTVKSGIIRFDLAKAQELLYELSLLRENIDSLVSEINRYAKQCDLPSIERIELESK